MNAFEATTSLAALREAWRSKAPKLRRSCFGVDRISAKDFERHLDRHLRELQSNLSDKSKPYKSQGLLALAKKKPNSEKYRIICVPTIADRLVQFAALRTLKNKLKEMGIDNPVSYGIAEGVHRSATGARDFACKARAERPWVYKTDIQQFFDNIDRVKLREAVAKVVRQPTLLPLLDSFIGTEISEGFDRDWRKIVVDNGIISGRGVRQGMPLSPLFAGAYLRDFDKKVIKWGVPAARYVDDIVAFFESEAAALSYHERMREALADLGLAIGQPNELGSKTFIVPPARPADFLGMQISRNPSGGYRLNVSKDCIADCAIRLQGAGEIDFLLEKKVSLTNMGRYFDSVVNGFLNSYTEASNRDVLRSAIEEASTAAQVRVLRELFGTNQFRSLNYKQLKFVGVDRDELLR